MSCVITFIWKSYLYYLMNVLLCVWISCSIKDPTSSHTTEKDWILYTVSTVGFGSSRLNKDKSANS